MRVGFFLVMLALVGCSSGFSEFYRDYSAGVPMQPLVGEPKVYGGSKNFERDILDMFEDGFALVGESSFNGALEDQAGAKQQAAKVGAHAVLLYSEFTDSLSGVVPFTTTRAVTTVHTGNVSTYGANGRVRGTYAGTSTSYVPQTTLIPYNVRRYDQMALYFAEMGPPCLGAYLSEASAGEKRLAASNRIVRIDAVRKGSPAYDENLFPGDLLVAINDGAVNLDSDTFGKSGETIKLSLLRASTKSSEYEPVTVEVKLGTCG